MAAQQRWTEISCVINGQDQELASTVLESQGALSVTLGDAADEALLEPAPGEQPLWQSLRITGLFPASCQPDVIIAALRDRLENPHLECSSDELEDRDWSSTWRESFHAMRFGDRLWICPSGETVDESGAVVIDLDPGLAFGTGTHPTTALCLAWLDGHLSPGCDVIDYGCGSGVLAIAACKLGAGRVKAVDIDPQALQATRENAQANGVLDKCSVSLPEGLPAGQVDLVIANILANPLVGLAGTLAGLVRPGGRIVLTGILAGQAGDIMAAYAHCFTFSRPLQRDEWVLLEGARQ